MNIGLRCMFCFVACCLLYCDVYAKTYKNDIVINPKKGSPEWVIRETLRAGFTQDFDTFYDELKHEDFAMRRDTRDFLWQSLVKWAPSYIIDRKKLSYKIVRTDPAKFDDKTGPVKFFIHSSKRDNPVPVVVKKDRFGRWRISMMSL